MAADIANFFFGNDIHEAEKNVARQLALIAPRRKLNLGGAEVDPKLFIAANNFGGAS